MFLMVIVVVLFVCVSVRWGEVVIVMGERGVVIVELLFRFFFCICFLGWVRMLLGI